MKKLVIMSIALLAVMALTGAETAQFGKIKLNVSLESTPPIYCKSTYPKYGKTSLTNKRWLVVGVEFTPGLASAESATKDGGARNVKSGTGLWLDDAKLAVRVLFPAEAPVSGRKKPVYGVFSGTTTFWSIPLDGKTHETAMMVPPQLLDRYLAMRSASGGGEMSAVKTDFIVEAIFFDRANRQLGRAYSSNLKTSGNVDSSVWFNGVCNNIPQRYRVENGVFSRNLTPWGVLDFTDCDLIRPQLPVAK